MKIRCQGGVTDTIYRVPPLCIWKQKEILLTACWHDLVILQLCHGGFGEQGTEAGEEKADFSPILRTVKDAECKTYPSEGKHTEIRLRGEGIIGAGLLHLSLFTIEAEQEEPRTRMARPSRRRFTI